MRQIEQSQGLKVATEFCLQFEETSAKENVNISEIFLEMARSLVNKVISFFSIHKLNLLLFL